jgi:hypothetical protein
MEKKVTCPICRICENTGNNGDMDWETHEGFTIGKGKKLYWMITWTKNGHAFVYSIEEDGGFPARRWVSGDQLITIHFK